MTALMLTVMQFFLLLCAVCCVVFFLRGPGAAERLVSLNVLSGVVLAFLVLRGVERGSALYLDVALVYDIFGFLGFLAIARFLRDRVMDGGDDSD